MTAVVLILAPVLRRYDRIGEREKGKGEQNTKPFHGKCLTNLAIKSQVRNRSPADHDKVSGHA